MLYGFAGQTAQGLFDAISSKHKGEDLHKQITQVQQELEQIAEQLKDTNAQAVLVGEDKKGETTTSEWTTHLSQRQNTRQDKTRKDTQHNNITSHTTRTTTNNETTITKTYQCKP